MSDEIKVPKKLWHLTWRNSTGPAGKVTLTFREIDRRIMEAYRIGKAESRTIEER